MNYGDLLLQKYNPYHDERGRFTDEGGASFVSTTNAKSTARMRAAGKTVGKQPKTTNTFQNEAGQWKHPSTGEKRIYLNNHDAGSGEKVWIHEDADYPNGWSASMRTDVYGRATVSGASVAAGTQRPKDVALTAAESHIERHGFDSRKVSFKELWDSAKPAKSK